jgi:hypothetical protein
VPAGKVIPRSSEMNCCSHEPARSGDEKLASPNELYPHTACLKLPIVGYPPARREKLRQALHHAEGLLTLGLESMFSMEYRRHLKSQTWHFCRDCSQWPRDFNIILSERLRPDSELCSECVALAQQREPKKNPHERSFSIKF